MESWKRRLGLSAEAAGMVEVVVDEPAEIYQGVSDEDVSEPETPLEERIKGDKRRRMAQEEVDRDGGYVVVYPRAGRGTLHKLGHGACWMAKRRGFVKCEVHELCPSAEVYSVRCRLCWPVEAERLPRVHE